MLSFSNGIPHATAENRVAHLSISIIITYITYLYLKACSFSDSISMLGVQRKIIQKKKRRENIQQYKCGFPHQVSLILR